MFIRNAWYIAAWADEVKDVPLGRKLLGENVVLFRDVHGRAAALEDRCCHRGAPLRFGAVTEQGLQCGYHGLVFDCAGSCVHIPGQDRIPGKAKVKSFPLVEKDQFLWIWMGAAKDADPSLIVDYPYHNDLEHWPHKHTMYHVKAGYQLMVDNLMDLTHLAYVHKSTIGGQSATAHVEAKTQVTPNEGGLHFVRWLLNSDPPPTYVKAVGMQGKIDRWMDFEYIAPGSIRQWTGALNVGCGAQENRNQVGGFSLRVFRGPLVFSAITGGTQTQHWRGGGVGRSLILLAFLFTSQTGIVASH
ncbi:Rieske 2Fe-2S domain-containing protein (plasmid) [Diaphorobacter sp. HDW4A]|uniref:Rieske 2Fe-2S domain-containing protein n=1 Tax=Diaphorobacter sp. HDW4A TaxID=2714924 RepID=UPI00140DB645|nr:Rieske 2Fe-2S domain-containing protein [Diaphorobacter sp. HDW4A]QIL84211.1 Rieske 2Fe-2S domain-containing protein [Diaphorobacter sp. HDW4A]